MYAHLDCKNAARLAEHVLDAVGKAAFVSAFVNECTRPLVNLGLLDAGISLSERALGMASEYGNWGIVYYERGELNKAEDMYKKALEIDKKIGRLEGQAIRYFNLGIVYKQRGDIGKAKEYWEKAVGLFKKIGMPHKVEKIEKWISELED